MPEQNVSSRRSFIKKTATASLGLSVGLSAQSYASILGANDRLNVGVIGLNGRGGALLRAAAAVENTAIRYICDVDTRAVAKGQKMAKEIAGKKAKGVEDFRELIEKKDLDALLIASPDHWHAPMAIMGLQAGKHIYVEKPCGHNPHEGVMLVEAQQKYGHVVQMGNQQRSGSATIEAINLIHAGEIGRAYNGKAWYANSRGSIGVGKKSPVPDWLNFELWQGPAPRQDYQDNLVHYNWHWFWNYGTGEICNNGTHELDICRWALEVDYPIRVTSSGGRYHFEDDWQFYDTQLATFEFAGNKCINWEGTSCNGLKIFNRGRGAYIQGTKGGVMLDRNGYTLYDVRGKVLKEVKEKGRSETTNTVGAGYLDSEHMKNFADAIRTSARQNSTILEGHKSVLMCHLGNIAQHTQSVLETDGTNGKIRNHPKAMKMWSREYQPGWELTV